MQLPNGLQLLFLLQTHQRLRNNNFMNILED